VEPDARPACFGNQLERKAFWGADDRSVMLVVSPVL
jgi:hypothetical protein